MIRGKFVIDVGTGVELSHLKEKDFVNVSKMKYYVDKIQSTDIIWVTKSNPDLEKWITMHLKLKGNNARLDDTFIIKQGSEYTTFSVTCMGF